MKAIRPFAPGKAAWDSPTPSVSKARAADAAASGRATVASSMCPFWRTAVTITTVRDERSGSDKESANAATAMPGGPGYGGGRRATAETGDRHPLRRWVEEGAERPMSVEELCDYLDRCPESSE